MSTHKTHVLNVLNVLEQQTLASLPQVTGKNQAMLHKHQLIRKEIQLVMMLRSITKLKSFQAYKTEQFTYFWWV